MTLTAASAARAAVIGSGFGGLALAIRLQAAGIATTLFEQRDQPGGRAYVYHDDGFTFDAGPTVITAPGCLEELFALAGERMADHVDLLPVMPFYRLFWEDGHTFDYSNDLAEVTRQIAARNPADVDGYRRFLAYAEQVFAEGYTKLAHVPFLDLWSMVPRRAAAGAARGLPHRLRHRRPLHPGRPPASGVQLPLAAGRRQPVRHLVDLHAHPRARTHLGRDVPARRHRRAGAGAGRALRAARRHGASSTAGRRASSPTTARSPACAPPTAASGSRRRRGQQRRRRAHLPHAARPRAARRRGRRARSSRKRFSMSLFLIYFGTRRRHPHLAHHNVIFGPRYRELLGDIFDRGVAGRRLLALSARADGLGPDAGAAGLRGVLRAGAGAAPGQARHRLDGRRPALRRSHPRLPRGALHPATCATISSRRRIFTPLDFQHELHAHHGSAFSLEPVLTQSAWFRVHNRDDPHAAASTSSAPAPIPGAGVPGVVNSAKATAGLMIGDLRSA